MNQLDIHAYAAPSCQVLLLAPQSGILSGAAPSASTKDISYEDI